MTRPPTKGPRSLTSTTTLRPLLRLVTRAQVGRGRSRLAALKARGRKGVPMEVVEPDSQPYHEATPRTAYPAACFNGA